jgi:hypothetical protein
MSNPFTVSTDGANAVCQVVRLESLFPELKRQGAYSCRTAGGGGEVHVEYVGHTASVSFTLHGMQTSDVERMLSLLLPYVKSSASRER